MRVLAVQDDQGSVHRHLQSRSRARAIGLLLEVVDGDGMDSLIQLDVLAGRVPPIIVLPVTIWRKLIILTAYKQAAINE